MLVHQPQEPEPASDDERIKRQAVIDKLLNARVVSTSRELLEEVRRLAPEVPIVVVSGPLTPEEASALIKSGSLEILPNLQLEQIDDSVRVARDTVRRATNSFTLATPADAKLTPRYLSGIVSPYLQALADIQHVIDEVRGVEPHVVLITQIRQKSPVSVSLDGAGDAIQTIRESVTPWRRQHAETMARLQVQEKSAEIENKKAEVLEKRALAAKDRAEAQKLVAEAERQREEAKKIRLENDKLRLETIRLALGAAEAYR